MSSARGQILVQARITRVAHKRLAVRAHQEGLSLAQVLRQQLESELSAPLHKRVRAIEVALIRFGVVPEGVRQI
jgi:hypothetical protein